MVAQTVILNGRLYELSLKISYPTPGERELFKGT
jgi:hypothetical protein